MTDKKLWNVTVSQLAPGIVTEVKIVLASDFFSNLEDAKLRLSRYVEEYGEEAKVSIGPLLCHDERWADKILDNQN